jgi:hypothetical protein
MEIKIEKKVDKELIKERLVQWNFAAKKKLEH